VAPHTTQGCGRRLRQRLVRVDALICIAASGCCFQETGRQGARKAAKRARDISRDEVKAEQIDSLALELA